MTENHNEYLCITSEKCDKKSILEKLPTYSSGLYHIDIKPVEKNMVSYQKLHDKELIHLWHDRLGHSGIRMMQKIIENSIGHLMKKMIIPQPNELSCSARSHGKLIIKPFLNKIAIETPKFLEIIRGDIL